MKPASLTFNAVSPVLEEQLRLQGWIILYWILWIDADNRRKKEHRRVLDGQKAMHEQQRRDHRPKPPAPAP